MDLAGIRADLVTVLEQLPDYEVYATLRANYDPPCFMIGVPIEIEYHATMDGVNFGGLRRVDIPIVVAVNGMDPEEAASFLDVVLSYGVSGSVPDVLEAAISGYTWRDGGIQVLGAQPRDVTQGDTEIAAVDLIVRLYA